MAQNDWMSAIGSLLGIPVGPGASGVNNLYGQAGQATTGAAGGYGGLMQQGQQSLGQYNQLFGPALQMLGASYGLPGFNVAGYTPGQLNPGQQTQLNASQDMLNRRLQSGLSGITANDALRGVTSGSGAANDLLTQFAGLAAQNQAGANLSAQQQQEQGALANLGAVQQLGQFGQGMLGQGAGGLSGLGSLLYGQGFNLLGNQQGVNAGNMGTLGYILSQVFPHLFGGGGGGNLGNVLTGANPQPGLSDTSGDYYDPTTGTFIGAGGNVYDPTGAFGGSDFWSTDPSGLSSGDWSVFGDAMGMGGGY